LLLIAPGCGEDASGPVSPTSAQSAVKIIGPYVVPVGSRAIYDATATWSNGSVAPATPSTWTVDNPDVATIEFPLGSSVILIGNAPGTATITVTHQRSSAAFTLEVRAAVSRADAARLEVSYRPDPVPGSATACPEYPLGIRSWAFAVVLTETNGIGFRLATETFEILDDAGGSVYVDTQPADEHIAANSTVGEEVCLGFLGHPYTSGFVSTAWEGVDDNGNRLAFASSRLRLSPVAAASSPTSTSLLPAPGLAAALLRSLAGSP
jgi:hypothetical protein